MKEIRVTGLGKSFGIDTVLQGIDLRLAPQQRIGLVGANGAGKSTFLKCILGILEPDEGTVKFADGATVGYLQQDIDFGGHTVREEMEIAWTDLLTCQAELERLAAAMHGGRADDDTVRRYGQLQQRFEWLGGYDYEAKTRRILQALGFSDADWERPASAFSGGQKTRLNLAKALVRQPDFLLLDEPTNHLDIEMTEWLEEYLRAFRGGVLMISHDRYFLDAIATDIVELAQTKLHYYRGNYSYYVREKAARREAAERAYAQQQEHIRREEEYIRKYKAGIKAKQARGRQSKLNRLERLDAPVHETTLDFHFPRATGTADKVLIAEDLAVHYAERTVFTDLSLLVRQGETIGIIGPNGVGKSTLLSILAGKRRPDSGRVTVGNRVRPGYYSQEHERLHPDYTVLKEVMYAAGCGEEEARHILGRFLFRGDEVYREIHLLSGGEKARLDLLLLLLEAPNVILLDEPTNHLDIATREVIEDALREFGGTYLVVSHDRYLLDRLVTRMLSFEDGGMREYHGNYTYWKAKRRELIETGALQPSTVVAPGAAVVPDEDNAVEEDAPRTVAPRSPAPAPSTPSAGAAPTKAVHFGEREARDLARLEQEISRSEATIRMYTQELSAVNPADAARWQQLTDALAAAQQELATYYEKWERLAAAAEAAER